MQTIKSRFPPSTFPLQDRSKAVNAINTWVYLFFSGVGGLVFVLRFACECLPLIGIFVIVFFLFLTWNAEVSNY